jgi:hypothetical protein
MKATSILLLFCALSFGLAAQDQDTTIRKIPYTSQYMAGALIGDSDNGMDVSLTMMHGIRYKRARFMLGFSYDEFREWKVMPLFATVSLDLNSKDNGLYVQLSSGHTFTRHMDTNNDYLRFRESGGRMLQPVLGYRIASGNWRMHVSAGYRIQRIFYEQGERWWYEVPGYDQRVRRDMNRVVFQIGFGIR